MAYRKPSQKPSKNRARERSARLSKKERRKLHGLTPGRAGAALSPGSAATGRAACRA